MAIDVTKILEDLAASGENWQAESNYLTSLTSERRNRLLGAIPSQAAVSLAAAPPMAVPANHPNAVDWRNQGGNHVTAVRDQGGCGACVSFSCCGVMESMAHIETGRWLDLSEADSHFCSNHGANCNGWWPDQCLTEMRVRGVIEEQHLPYASAFPQGDIWKGPPVCVAVPIRNTLAVKCNGPIMLTGNNAIKNHLAAVGPVAGCFDVFDDFFAYSSGVYAHVSGNFAGGHCVLVIGFSDARQCWIAKNSWGSAWGMGGFFEIAYTAMILNGQPFPMYGTNGIV